MLKILLGEFYSDLRSQKLRVFLTMFAVMWGTITIVLLLAFGEGLKQSLVAGIVNAGDRILMVYGGQTSLNFEGMSKGRPIRLTEDDMLLIKQSLSREVEAVSPSYGDRKSVVSGQGGRHGGTRTRCKRRQRRGARVR